MGRTSGNRPPRPAAGLRADTAGRAVAAGPAGGEAGAALRAGGREGREAKRREGGRWAATPQPPLSRASLRRRSCILSEVSTRSRSKLPSGKSVLLLGEHRGPPARTATRN